MPTPTNLFHGTDLGGRAHPTDGQADVDGGTDALVEELRLKEDLSVRDRDNVGWDVGRHVASLRLDDGEGSQGAAAEVVVHLRRSLEETRVEIEDVAGVGLTTRRPTQQEGHLAVGNGLRRRGEIVM